MSFSEKNIQTFIELLTDQRALFSPEQLTELERAIDPIEDNVESLSEVISTWLENHSKIDEAQNKLIESPINISSGIKSSERAPGSQQGQVPQPNPLLNKRNLQNAIQQGIKPDDFQSSTKKTTEK